MCTHFKVLFSAEISAESFGQVAEISVSAETENISFGRTLVQRLLEIAESFEYCTSFFVYLIYQHFEVHN